MNLDEFYKEVEEIETTPLDLTGINSVSIRGFEHTPRHYYNLLQIEGPTKYLTGIITPTREEIREFIRAAAGGMEGLANSDVMKEAMGEEPPEGLTEYTEDLLKPMEETQLAVYGSPEMMARDIRMRAKKIGADGIIHLQLYNKDSVYMGYPVKYMPISDSNRPSLPSWPPKD